MLLRWIQKGQKKTEGGHRAGEREGSKTIGSLTDARINILQYHTPKAIYEPISTANKTPYLCALCYTTILCPGLLLAVKHWLTESLNFIVLREISMQRRNCQAICPSKCITHPAYAQLTLNIKKPSLAFLKLSYWIVIIKKCVSWTKWFWEFRDDRL